MPELDQLSGQTSETSHLSTPSLAKSKVNKSISLSSVIYVW